MPQSDFNSYGARRGNHEVMMRGTFANIRIKNQMVKNDDGSVVEGGYTIHQPSGERMFIYDAAMRYQAGRPRTHHLRRQGIRHRLLARLGGQGHDAPRRPRRGRRELRAHPPLEPDRHGRAAAAIRRTAKPGQDLGLTGEETVSISGVAALGPRQKVTLKITRPDGKTDEVEVHCRIDTENEVEYFRNGGILHYVLRGLARRLSFHGPVTTV